MEQQTINKLKELNQQGKLYKGYGYDIDWVKIYEIEREIKKDQLIN